LNFLDRLSTNTGTSNLIKTHPVGAELSHAAVQADERTNGRTDGEMHIQTRRR